VNVDPVLGSAPHAGLGHDEYASAVRIEPLPERLYDAAIRLWQDSGLTRPWNDPEADLRRAAGGGSSCVLAAIGDDDGLLATAIVGQAGGKVGGGRSVAAGRVVDARRVSGEREQN
jgi:hypothetical protein